jgi:glycosyltransferase involved in cell wall biosynthesis
MKISIITVCFNSGKTIRTAVESVLAQNYKDVEYIVIDGGSTDDTLTILSEYQYVINHIISEPDNGIYDAMNKGIALATGDFIGILNSDDFYPNNRVLNEVAETHLNHPDVDILLGGVDFVYSGKITKVIRHYPALPFKPWKLRFGFMPPHPGAFIKRIAYKKVGHYKTNYRIGADFDFFVRAFLSYKLSYLTIDCHFVRMRVGGVSTSGFSSYRVTTLEMLRSFRENGLYTNIVFVLLRLPIKKMQMLKSNL